MKGLFSIKLSKTINDFGILINIDETMFSGTTKTSHSWLLKGEEAKLMNILFTCSTSIIKPSLHSVMLSQQKFRDWWQANILSSFFWRTQMIQ